LVAGYTHVRSHVEPWFESTRLVERATVEIAFLLAPTLYYGPDSHPAVSERKEVEPLRIPQFERAQPSVATSHEALGHIDELVAYYRDVILKANKHRLPFERVRSHFWLRLGVFNSEENLHLSFPWYDTISEMEPILQSFADPGVEGELFWDRDQCWELQVIAQGQLLYIREWDPDYEETHVLAKIPRGALAVASADALKRARLIVSELARGVGVDVWTKHCTPAMSEFRT